MYCDVNVDDDGNKKWQLPHTAAEPYFDRGVLSRLPQGISVSLSIHARFIAPRFPSS